MHTYAHNYTCIQELKRNEFIIWLLLRAFRLPLPLIYLRRHAVYHFLRQTFSATVSIHPSSFPVGLSGCWWQQGNESCPDVHFQMFPLGSHGFPRPTGDIIPPAHLGSGQVSPPVCHALYTLKGRYPGGMTNRCPDPLRTLFSAQRSRGWTLRTSLITELLILRE